MPSRTSDKALGAPHSALEALADVRGKVGNGCQIQARFLCTSVSACGEVWSGIRARACALSAPAPTAALATVLCFLAILVNRWQDSRRRD